MGRWDKLKSKLAPFEHPPDFRAKVDTAKRELAGENVADANVASLARSFADKKRQKDALEAEVRELNVSLEALSELLVERLEGEEQQKVELADGLLVYLSSEPYAAVQDRKKVFDWIKKNKLAELLTVQWQTLNALVKDRLEEGQAPPPGVAVYLKTRARLRGIRNNQQEERA